jgi:HK97 gp10 family phage protein
MAKKSEVNTSDVKNGLQKLAIIATEAELKVALTAGALPILEQSKINTPILTGNLRRSEKITNFQYSNNGASIDIGTNVEYAPHVEFGTIHQSAQPFLRPAFDEKKVEALKQVKDSLKAILDAKII